MGKVEITYDRAVEFLNRAVEEKGEGYVYPRNSGLKGPVCSYERDGKPSCIVGHVLHYAGVPVEDLIKMDINYSLSTFDVLVYEGALDDLNIEISDPRALTLLITAQATQDGDGPWGMARDLAMSATNRK